MEILGRRMAVALDQGQIDGGALGSDFEPAFPKALPHQLFLRRSFHAIPF
jgi:hypothetical protein